MIDHWSNMFRMIWASTLGPMGFLLNLLLGYIIFKYTPDSMKTYSTMIMVMTISDAVTGLCRVMTAVRMISAPSQLFVIFGGICQTFFDEKLTKSRFCMYWYALLIQCNLLNSIIMIFSYVYRAYVITMPFDTINQKKIQLLSYGYSLCHFSYFTWVYYMSWSSLEAMDAEISKIYPEIIGSNYTYSGILDLNAPSQIETKKQQHRSLVNVLLYQTITPLLSLVSVFLYVTVGRFGGSTVLLENLMPFSVVIVSVVGPIASCILIGPYRTALFKLWSSAVSMIFGVESRLRKNTVRTTVSVTNLA
ncbi:hypothetical protein CRE_15986 [Caenorhabditis remanei]|uniref:Uncharacterized protein n=1 Tax=Caenorhabditis remanei TaxID=31234 RepID=E3MBY3_CAERE|nr:hypothetical protein CRE_15986 [Caenorhabditis remanei]